MLGLLASCGAERFDPPAEGIPLELAERRARTLSGLAYAFELSIPAERDRAILGSVDIDFVWTDPEGAPLVLDFLEPLARVREVRVNGTPVEWEASHDHIVVASAALEPDTANRVEVDFAAGDEALNRRDDFLYTLFVPDRAHFSLPLFDQPDLKGTVAWRIDAPAGWTVVANGPELEVPADTTGGVWAFAASKPISSYLMAFAAGRFRVEQAVRGGRTWRLYHRETDDEKVARNREAIFDLHASALAWLEDYTAIDYPFEKFDIVAVPSFQYGGMEHPGAVFYRQAGLFLDESATQANQLGRASVIAHETAHMWFGDLVTMRWFDDVWMKEVFANFMAARIVNPAFPDVDHGLRFLLAHHPSAYGVDRTPGSTPIRQPLDNLREAGTLYGPIIYQKAPIVMAHLERTVGPETFRDGLREYLERYAFGNATWADLVEILDALHPDDLTEWSRVWVEEPGRPAIRIGWEPDGSAEGHGSLVLTQSDDWGRERAWPQRLTVHAEWDGRAEWTDVEFESGQRRVVVWEGVERPDFVVPNAAGIEYGLFHLDDAWLAALADRLPSIRPDLLRGTALLLLSDALLEERIEPEVLLDRSLAALAVEDNELVANELVDLIGGIFWRYLPEDRREARAPEVEAGLWRRVEQARSRTLRATLFGAWRRVVVTESGVRQLRAFWEEEAEVPGVPLSVDDLTGIAAGLALRGAVDTEALLDRQAERIVNPDARARFDFTRPALSAEPPVRSRFFSSLLEPENREREPWALRGLGYLHHPLRHPASIEFVGPALDELPEIQRTGDIFFPQRWLGATLGSYNRPEVWAEIDAFVDRTPELPPRLRAKLDQEADGVRRAIRIVRGAAAAPPWGIR